MTDKQLKQAKSQLPQGERFDRAYSAYEGGIRLISKKSLLQKQSKLRKNMV